MEHVHWHSSHWSGILSRMDTSQNSPTSFLLRYQEAHDFDEKPDVLCATSTMTKTLEEPDQDPDVSRPRVCGTGTRTLTIEDPDQDPRLLATRTMTETSETPDQDPSHSGYFAIPRA